MSFLSKLVPSAAIGIPIAKAGFQKTRQLSMEMYGYDFVGLIVKTLIFYVAAWVLSKYVEAALFNRGGWLVLVSLFGIFLPKREDLPKALVQLFETGYNGIKYWDIINAINILMTVAAALEYAESQKTLGGKISPQTIGVFAIIIFVFSMMTLPKLIKTIQTAQFQEANK